MTQLTIKTDCGSVDLPYEFMLKTTKCHVLIKDVIYQFVLNLDKTWTIIPIKTHVSKTSNTSACSVTLFGFNSNHDSYSEVSCILLSSVTVNDIKCNVCNYTGNNALIPQGWTVLCF